MSDRVSRRPPSAATLRRLERASGSLATRAVARMDDELPWFRTMPADQRSWVMLVAQAGLASFVEWCRTPDRPPRLTGEVFGAAPRELARVVPLKHTVDLVRVTVEVMDDFVGTVAEPGDADVLRLAVLQYSREVAFATAHVYATFAESRGAWDARLEALLVDALVRGERPEELSGRASALGWAAMTPVTVLVGAAPQDGDVHAAIRRAARQVRSEVLVGVHADQLVVVLGGSPDLQSAAERVSDEFGPGPVVTGPVVDGLGRAGDSASAALAGLRAAPAWPGAPRPVAADALLPERALDGDPSARTTLQERIAQPLQAAGGEVLETVRAVLASGGNLEASARALFVHPNTVRYRLRRATEMTGLPVTDPRGAWTVQVALALAALDQERSLWH
ncbi:PucR family transcriptional regulator [Geodermatophilus obscurus]|uniref:Putative transcriptional regulator, PucR family n=1 Tax=Geodermatophilus obscurus (strain ATCC 25078 / DSM 43160 / JCM 3152 / CCUG 61914 / KCC A-0152 / KCTC 9177 / NBRC 13315 / NRRL B-3577 / G-20) TaxID=526225 RepID=D2SBJ4_GEOOG|nr:PucR family transcriptional regulator [Geodermatophilus obscurus]ADB76101.1 putative transcriptional regulator, PucR family [Geodermatophilus obscurus DSM 43160]